MTRRGYRQQRRDAKRHFIRRWKERISDKPPQWDLIVKHLHAAVNGKPSGLLRLFAWDYKATKWKTPLKDGGTAIIVYNHETRVPVTCWRARREHEQWDVADGGAHERPDGADNSNYEIPIERRPT